MMFSVDMELSSMLDPDCRVTTSKRLAAWM